ncbi:MAG: YggS family pyridoxal phosphate-dependent enzyme [Bacteroidales bacterium]
MSVADKLKTVFEKLPDDVKLIAISKTKSTGQIMQVYHAGHRVFGESKAQELLPKYEALPKDIRWHMVGHLQSNKVKYIAPFIELIHSIDSLKLLKVVNKEARKNMRIIQCLLQIHIAQEESKYGLQFEEACEILESESFRNMENVEICGLMGMATLTGNTEKVRSEFRQLKRYFDLIREKYFAGKASFKEISMGMSGDYELAIEEGSTMVRIGSAIFGERED